MHTNTFYQKPVINTIMKLALKRLRVSNIHVPDVIAAINMRGIALTRARFDDLFLIRPERDSSASCDVFAVVVAVLFSFDAQVLTTNEFFQLAIAMRIPINRYVEFMRFFPKDAWHSCMRAYGFEMVMPHHALAVVGREVLLSQYHDMVLARQNLLIVGPLGMGKKAFAEELLRIYAAYYGVDTYTIDARRIQTPADIFVALATNMHVPTQIPTASVRQLAHMMDHLQTYILLTNIDESPLDPYTLTQAIHTHFPALRCIATAHAAHVPHYTLVELTALPANHPQAAACHLYKHARLHADLPLPAMTTIMDVCQSVGGVPHGILLAATLPHPLSPSASLSAYINAHLDALTAIEFRLLAIVHVWPTRLSTRWVHIIMARGMCDNATAIDDTLNTLAQRQLLSIVPHTASDVIHIHRCLAAGLSHRVSADMRIMLYQDIASALGYIDWRWEHDYRKFSATLTRDDIEAGIEFVGCLLAHALFTEASHVLTQWHSIWRAFGFSRDIHTLFEQWMPHLRMAHTTGAMEYLYGCVMVDCGEYHAGIALFAEVLSRSDTMPLLRARVLLDWVDVQLTHETSTHRDVTALFDALTRAHALFTSFVMPQWQLRAENLQVMVHWYQGNYAAALAHNDRAMHQFHHVSQSLAHLDTVMHRGMVMLSLGEVRSARNYLLQALRAYSQTALPVHHATCRIWLCAIALLEHDIDLVMQYMRQLLAGGDYLVSPSVFVMFLDVVMALMASHQSQINNRYALALCVDRMRSAWHLTPDVHSSVVAFTPIPLTQYQLSATCFAAEMTVAEVVDALHTWFADAK